jgi:hypothetical protein
MTINENKLEELFNKIGKDDIFFNYPGISYQDEPTDSAVYCMTMQCLYSFIIERLKPYFISHNGYLTRDQIMDAYRTVAENWYLGNVQVLEFEEVMPLAALFFALNGYVIVSYKVDDELVYASKGPKIISPHFIKKLGLDVEIPISRVVHDFEKNEKKTFNLLPSLNKHRGLKELVNQYKALPYNENEDLENEKKCICNDDTFHEEFLGGIVPLSEDILVFKHLDYEGLDEDLDEYSDEDENKDFYHY